jgi:hypothetical protein
VERDIRERRVGTSGGPPHSIAPCLWFRVSLRMHTGSQKHDCANPFERRTFKKMGASADQFRFFALMLFTFFLRSFMARVGWMPAMVNAVRTDLGGSDLLPSSVCGNAIARLRLRVSSRCSRGEKCDTSSIHRRVERPSRHEEHGHVILIITQSNTVKTDATCS